ncbi:MAG TPA: type III pantothenate kinase [Flavobacteriales bacterium]|nr:type III pantothenate kinase [Flavobacteriales bacterium]
MPVLNADLVLDVGNTRTKLALFQGRRALRHGWVNNGDMPAVLSFSTDITVEAIAVGSTATPDPGFLAQLETMAPTMLITGASPAPLRNAYGTPLTLGADRLADAVAAVQRFPGRTVLVLDLGTCLTYELCLADGTYAGGGISPGLRMRAQAMHAYSARLPLVEPAEQPALVGTDTGGALLAGIHFGMLGELEGYIRRFRNAHPDLAVVLTGGDAPRFVSGLESGIFALPLLTLEGYHALLLHRRTLVSPAGTAATDVGRGPGTAG